MRNHKEIEDAYQTLAQLVNNGPRFKRMLPGVGAQQFALGVAAGLDFAKGKEVRPVSEMVAWIKTAIIPYDNVFDPVRGREN